MVAQGTDGDPVPETPSVWTGVGPAAYAGEKDRYQEAILEQYRVYVEMAERLSVRRGLANTFFMGLNTLIVGTLATVGQKSPVPPVHVLAILLIPLLAQCAAWFAQVRSYRQLSAAKYVVIGALEERLPASPFFRAEWNALGEGRNWRLYWPLTRLEQVVPALFAVTYLLGFTVAVTR